MNQLPASSRLLSDGDLLLAAECQEYWSRADKDPKIRDYSHWLGYGRFIRRSSWASIGEDSWSRFVKCCNLAGRDVGEFNRCVEWGSGGGANAARFLKHFREFYGVDVSPASARESARVLEGAQGFFTPILIRGDYPDSVLETVRQDVDFFLSVATFQHLPTKSYALAVMKIAYMILARGGLAVVQTRLDDGSAYYRTKTKQYSRGKNAIRFLSFKLEEFSRLCERAGLEVLYAGDVRDGISYAYYYLRKE